MTEELSYTCDCRDCGREFDNNEFLITQDSKKCILHCEKNLENNWYKKDFSEHDKIINELIGETPDINNPNDINLSRDNTVIFSKPVASFPPGV